MKWRKVAEEDLQTCRSFLEAKAELKASQAKGVSATARDEALAAYMKLFDAVRSILRRNAYRIQVCGFRFFVDGEGQTHVCPITPKARTLPPFLIKSF